MIASRVSTMPFARQQPALLADSLEVLRLQSWILGSLNLDREWGVQVTGRLGWFHLVGEHLQLEADGRHIGSVAPGDLVLAFPGYSHQFARTVGSPLRDLVSLRSSFRCVFTEPGDARSVTALGSLTCGCFLLDGIESTPLHGALPPVIHVAGQSSRPPGYVEHILRLILDEVASAEPCAHLIINRLVRLLLIKTLHHYVCSLPPTVANWLTAITDGEIGRALALMHDRPEAPWSVASLADEVALSRSVFSARFTAMVGRPPLEYLFEWRMQKAAYLLRIDRAELKEVATRVGYESASAFSKAFTRWSGAPPGVYRERMREQALSGARPPPL